MNRLLRLNTRHSLFFPGDGKMPELNPITSWSHAKKSGKRTRRWDEPLWLFRLRQRLFCFGGMQRCSRRDESMRTQPGEDALPDTWDWGPDGSRTCSYCGSAHPDDLMRIARLTVTDARYGVSPSDKGYKVYLEQPGVRNASEGAIKFYMQHAPQHVSDLDQAVFRTAVKITRERHDAKWRARGVA